MYALFASIYFWLVCMRASSREITLLGKVICQVEMAVNHVYDQTQIYIKVFFPHITPLSTCAVFLCEKCFRFYHPFSGVRVMLCILSNVCCCRSACNSHVSCISCSINTLLPMTSYYCVHSPFLSVFSWFSPISQHFS